MEYFNTMMEYFCHSAGLSFHIQKFNASQITSLKSFNKIICSNFKFSKFILLNLTYFTSQYNHSKVPGAIKQVISQLINQSIYAGDFFPATILGYYHAPRSGKKW